MAKVAVVRSWYLPASETFIYSELRNLKNISAIMCTKKVMNLDRFPFEPIYKFQNMQELRDILAKQKVDLIHARFGLTGAEILEVKKKLGLPMITSFHGFDVPSNKQSFRKYGGKLKELFETGEMFTVTSKDMKKILMKYGCPEKKIIVHHSGIDVNKFTYRKREYPQNGKVTILTVGRLVEKKGTTYLLDAFRKIQKQYPNTRLRIVGDGPFREKLQQQARDYKLQNIKFLGELSHDQVIKEMNGAHLFVLPSITGKLGNREGIPNVLKEAMASGMPVISTYHGGIPELVTEGKSGFLVKERDASGLADKVIKLLHKPEQWAKMGKYGRKQVEAYFNQEKQVTELEEIYAKMLTHGGVGDA